MAAVLCDKMTAVKMRKLPASKAVVLCRRTPRNVLDARLLPANNAYLLIASMKALAWHVGKIIRNSIASYLARNVIRK